MITEPFTHIMIVNKPENQCFMEDILWNADLGQA